MLKNAKEYHYTTSYERNRIGGHILDWQNQPVLYKEYKGLTSIPLPESVIPSGTSLKSILNFTAEPVEECVDINKISTILRLTYCITAESRFSKGIYYYRSAASAGALYPVEIYLMARDIKGLENGLYHFNIMDHSLARLREGDFSGYTGNISVPRTKEKPVMSIILSSIFFRSSWKYRDRAYRYHLLDTGHVLENLSLALKFLKIPFETACDFDDDSLNQLVGIDGFREASLALINIPGKDILENDSYPDITPLPDEIAGASIMSGNDIDYPAIREIHEAGKIIPPAKTLGKILSSTLPEAEKWENIDPSKESKEGIPYPESLFRRRSKRNFMDNRIKRSDLISILDIISFHGDSSGTGTRGKALLQAAFFAEKVEDVSPGLYSLDMQGRKFVLLEPGAFGKKIAYTCLEQEWLKNSALHFLFFSDLDKVDKIYGPRGYRYALMNAGMVGQLLYITATSLGLGCCGIGAFYDSEAADLLNLEESTRLLYLIALGKIKK